MIHHQVILVVPKFLFDYFAIDIHILTNVWDKYMKNGLTLFCLIAFLGLSHAQEYSDMVNPFIGSSNSGNTFPGAVLPWGMVSLSPHNSSSPSGYEFAREYINGFGNVHISGAGCPDQGGVIFMPVRVGNSLNPNDYQSHYSDEVASPGYYKVLLKEHSLVVECTATDRSTMARIKSPQSNEPFRILIDVSRNLGWRRGGAIEILNNGTTLRGFNTAGGFCGAGSQHNVYFYSTLSPRPDSIKLFKGNSALHTNALSGVDTSLVAVAYYSSAIEDVTMRTGISYVNTVNAQNNLELEQGDLSFEAINTFARSRWNSELSRITIETPNTDDKTIFYTALYHTLIHPSILNDVNGDYPAMGHDSIANSGNRNRYTIYSLWDTYRTLHPLLTLVYPERQADMVQSMVDMYHQNEWLPKWELASNETFIMVGDPAAPVIADTYLKGVRNFDYGTAYKALIKGASLTDTGRNPLRPGLRSYLKYGYIPHDDTSEYVWGSASTTLEYNIADFSISRLAQAFGNVQDYMEYDKRSKSYKNLFDPQTGFIRPKLLSGKFYEPFDPLAENTIGGWPGSGGPGYVEGNAWHYTFFVDHDIEGLIALFGGAKPFIEKLEKTFAEKHFILWNEPDMSYPYLFSFVKGEQWRTYKYVTENLKTHFNNTPGGLPGNDDCGTISAWYIFSSLGFYPIATASNNYMMTIPHFSKSTIKLNPTYYPGKQLEIIRTGNLVDGPLKADIKLNAKTFKQSLISHYQLIEGGKLEFRVQGVKK